MIRALSLLLFSFAAGAQQYMVSTFAGGVPPATPATAAAVSIGDPPRVTVDAAGNLYFASLYSVYKVDRAGLLVRLAGTGRKGLTGDGGPALAAQLSNPVGVAVDGGGNVYFAERDANLIRRISATGAISAIPIDGLNGPMGMLFDPAGNLYIADTRNNTVRKVAPNNVITTVAGNGSPGFAGDGGAATAASLNGPEGIALDRAGNLYIADTFNHRVRMVSPNGVITTFAGVGSPGFSGDDAEAANAHMILPTDVAVDAAGAIYVADLGNSRIRRVANGIITTIAGNGGGLPPRDGLNATAVRLSGPTGIAVDPTGGIYIAEGSIGSGSGLDGGIFRIWRVAAGTISAAAGVGLRSFSGDGGPAALAQFDTPAGMTVDSKGNLYVADSANNRVRKIGPDGVVTTIAGNALPGFAGDTELATGSELNRPTGVATDAAGNIYIADSGNNRIRVISPAGTIGTLAGNGNTAFFGDRGSSVEAALNRPRGVAVDAAGAVYIADTGNRRIRRVLNGVIDTVAENLVAPSEVAVDASGAIWVADSGDGTLRRFFRGGSISVPLPGARGIAVDPFGNVFASGLDRIVKVSADGSTTVIAGAGQCCYEGDGGPAAAARFNAPWGLAPDSAGNLYIADSGNNAIRLATVASSTFFIRSIVNTASNRAGSIAPGEIITIYGAGLGPAALSAGVASDGVLPTTVSGTRVLINGTAAPLIYVAAGQISAIVPYSISGDSAQIVVQAPNLSMTSPFSIGVTANAPGIFTADSTGSGPALALNGDGSANSSARPAPAGSILVLFATGEGQTTPAGSDGRIVTAPAPEPVAAVSVIIGGRNAPVQRATGLPGAPAGLLQVVVTVPAGATGQLPVVMLVGNSQAQSGVTVSVQ
jgi:uncharacterized protein (TIGR03437 family)